MSVSVGNMSAGLDLNLDGFKNGMTAASELARSNSALMSASMKQSAREGAESFRLIDEALGIHVSRPLTRILTQEFPELASALQAVLGVGIGGAVAAVGVEAFDKVSKGIENAKKAQEEYIASIQHTEDVIGDMAAAHTRAMTEIKLQLAALQGDPGAKLQLAQFKIDTSSMAEAKKNVEAITKAIEEQSKAAEKARNIWVQLITTFVTGPYDFWQKLISGGDEAGNKLKQVDALVASIMRQHAGDPMAGLKDSLKEVTAEAQKTFSDLYTLQITNAALANKLNVTPGQGISGAKDESALASGQEKAQNLTKVYLALEAQIKAIKGAIDEAMGTGKIDAATGALEKQRKVQEDITALYKEMGSSIAKLQPETDPIKKIDSEIAAFRATAESNFREVAKAGDTLELTAARAALRDYLAQLERIKVLLESEALAKKLPSPESLNGPFGAAYTGTGTAAPASQTLAQTPVMPQLGGGGLPASQFDTFAADQAAQLKLAAAAYADIITPQQKYELTMQELNLLLEKGTIDQGAYTAAQQKANEVLDEASDKLEKLLKKTGDANAGLEAFFLQLDKSANRDGAFTFDLLNKALDGFENNTVQALTGGKTHWRSYFESLTDMALKFELNKLFSGPLEGLGKLLNPGQNAGLTAGIPLGPGATQLPTALLSQPLTAGVPLGPGATPLPTALLPQGVGAGAGALTGGGTAAAGAGSAALNSAGSTLTSAGTTLSTAGSTLSAAGTSLGTSGTTLSTAASTLLSAGSALTAAASSLSAGGAGSGAGLAAALIPHAGGGDLTPGASYLVGEQGPEPLTVDESGQSFISPHSSMTQPAGGGDTHNHYYDLRGADPAVVQRLISALPQVEERAVARAVAASSEIGRRTANL
jgi:hypothetical protein